MFSNIFNNIPNADKIKRPIPLRINTNRLVNPNKHGTEEPNIEEFENYVASLQKTSLISSIVKETKESKDDTYELDIEDDDTKKGERQLSILSSISSNEKPVPKKIPDVKGINNESDKEVNTNNYKLDKFTQLYIGSISIVALFLVYKSMYKK